MNQKTGEIQVVKVNHGIEETRGTRVNQLNKETHLSEVILYLNRFQH